MDKLLLTPTEAATALGIGRSKVYELMQTGQLQSVHIGACRRIPVDDLNALVARMRSGRVYDGSTPSRRPDGRQGGRDRPHAQ